MADNKHFSVPIKDLTFELYKDFLKLKFYAISEGENTNKTNFILGSIKECMATNDYANKPILGAWDKYSKNLKGHDSDLKLDKDGKPYNSYLGENCERPLGLILPNSAKIEEYKGKQWLTFEGLIWIKYNKEVVDFIQKKKEVAVSVEIGVPDKLKVENGIEIIDSFILNGITIIGKNPGIPNACARLFEFTETDNYLEFVKNFNIEKEKVFNQQFGIGEPLKIKLDKDNVSYNDWAEISKGELKTELLLAENYEKIIPKSYLVVYDDWKENPSEGLLFPVVEIKKDIIVFNINAIKCSEIILKEKETEYPTDIYKLAIAKLARIKKLLDIQDTIESNTDTTDKISNVQPKTINMEEIMAKRTECKSTLSALLKEFNELQKKYDELAESETQNKATLNFEEDETKKGEIQSKLDTINADKQDYSQKIYNAQKEIITEVNNLLNFESDIELKSIIETNKEFTNEVKDYCKEKSYDLISQTDTFVVYKDNDKVFCSEYKIKEEKLEFSDAIEIDKLFVKVQDSDGETKSFKFAEVTALFSKFDEKLQEQVKLYEEEKEKKEEYEKELKKEKEEKTEELEKKEKEFSSYKDKVKELVLKFDTIQGVENLDSEKKQEILNKVFNNEYSNTEDFEVKVESLLYKTFKENLKFNLPSSKTIENKENKGEIQTIVEKYINE